MLVHTYHGPDSPIAERQWHSTDASFKAKFVCRECNNGWMSELEGEAKPLLLPLMFGDYPRMELSPDEQETVAMWREALAGRADARPVFRIRLAAFHFGCRGAFRHGSLNGIGAPCASRATTRK